MSSPLNRRAATALETRRLILDAALELFTAQGYGATSVGDVAARAGVAVPTVYTSVGKKPELLRGLLDRLDDMADVPLLAREGMSSTDPAHVLRTGVRITRLFAERCGDIIAAIASAASVEPEMASVYRAGMNRHLAGVQGAVDKLRQLKALQPRLPRDDAVAIFYTITSHTTWAMLVKDHGWTFDQAEAWIINVLQRELFAP